jgi:hypothetical protein
VKTDDPWRRKTQKGGFPLAPVEVQEWVYGGVVRRLARPEFETYCQERDRTDGMNMRTPTWTGADGEMAVIVSRGDPRRSDLQMEQAVAGQLRDYLMHHGKGQHPPTLLALITQLIAKDYITPDGSQQVTLTREHLLAYVQVARERLGELERARGDQ